MEIEGEALKETIHIKDAKAATFQDFNTIIKPFYKATRLTFDKIISNFIEPIDLSIN